MAEIAQLEIAWTAGEVPGQPGLSSFTRPEWQVRTVHTKEHTLTEQVSQMEEAQPHPHPSQESCARGGTVATASTTSFLHYIP